ncbi:MAG: TfoX/Sxy family DNA transformation protein [Clostridia bacterium]|nr:TfoX/Sxy family DNA transformation protein [Clostridia bacterium]
MKGELQKLNNIGIYNYEDLVDCGSTEAWLKIKEIDPTTCINRLMALEGAIQNIRWHNLSDIDKKYLKYFYESNR